MNDDPIFSLGALMSLNFVLPSPSGSFEGLRRSRIYHENDVCSILQPYSHVRIVQTDFIGTLSNAYNNFLHSSSIICKILELVGHLANEFSIIPRRSHNYSLFSIFSKLHSITATFAISILKAERQTTVCHIHHSQL